MFNLFIDGKVVFTGSYDACRLQYIRNMQCFAAFGVRSCMFIKEV